MIYTGIVLFVNIKNPNTLFPKALRISASNWSGNSNSSVAKPSKNWVKKIQDEWRILEKDLPGDSQIGLNVTALDPSTVASEVWYGKESGNYSMKMTGVSTFYSQLYPFEGLWIYTSGVIHHMKIDGPSMEAHNIRTEATGPPSKLLDGSFEFVLTYEDTDGDWMLAGDVPLGGTVRHYC